MHRQRTVPEDLLPLEKNGSTPEAKPLRHFGSYASFCFSLSLIRCTLSKTACGVVNISVLISFDNLCFATTRRDQNGGPRKTTGRHFGSHDVVLLASLLRFRNSLLLLFRECLSAGEGCGFVYEASSFVTHRFLRDSKPRCKSYQSAILVYITSCFALKPFTFFLGFIAHTFFTKSVQR